jgi:Plavaka transposase
MLRYWVSENFKECQWCLRKKNSCEKKRERVVVVERKGSEDKTMKKRVKKRETYCQLFYTPREFLRPAEALTLRNTPGTNGVYLLTPKTNLPSNQPSMPMGTICSGCGAAFKRSGLAHHLRQSQDPRCRLPRIHQKSDDDLGVQATSDDEPPAPFPMPPVTHEQENEPQDLFWLRVDPAGDIFGDYNDYTAADFGIGDEDEQDFKEPFEGEEDPESLADTQEEVEIAGYEAFLAEEEHGLEPERPIQGPDISDQVLEPDALPSRGPFRLRGGFEEPLSNRPEIVKFSAGNPGAVHGMKRHNGNLGYHQSLSDANNPNQYRPFASKLDWEIGRWAKMRGPGSSALTELLSIEGVSFPLVRKLYRRLTDLIDKVVARLGLSYKNAAELNKLIDEELPGRPSFQREEVIVGTEVCDVYFRDVIACVRALFADPDLAKYLVMAPEKHFTYGSDGTKIRMYHDMHTAKWWWSTQVIIKSIYTRPQTHTTYGLGGA